jgi:HAD superfamily hydrolase (TIGR01549 family)
LDGTLVDTAPFAFEAFQKTLHELGIRIRAEQYEAIYSPNWYGMYRALGVPETLWQKADEGWLQHYASAEPQMVAEGKYTLQELHSRGYRLGVVTSGSSSRVMREISGFGLSDIFTTVVCNEDVVHKKPHPEGLHTAMRHLGKEPEVCCYVGDSPDDIEMGRRANVHTIGIPGRYPNSQRIRDSHPDYCFESIVQLLAHFQRSAPPCQGLHP